MDKEPHKLDYSRPVTEPANRIDAVQPILICLVLFVIVPTIILMLLSFLATIGVW